MTREVESDALVADLRHFVWDFRGVESANAGDRTLVECDTLREMRHCADTAADRIETLQSQLAAEARELHALRRILAAIRERLENPAELSRAALKLVVGLTDSVEYDLTGSAE